MQEPDVTRDILNELGRALAAIGEGQACAFVAAVAAADDIFVTGQGRSGLMAAAFATRLVQLGKRAHVAGAPTAPAAGKGSLLIACSGSGRTRTAIIHAEGARAAGARVWAITRDATSPLAAAADNAVAIPPIPSIQPGGSGFEQALLVFLDSVVMLLMAKLGQTAETMVARHSNLE
jgi:6-phospho-3-hexuloisomerase